VKYSTKYLFDIEPQELMVMLYPDALNHKLTNAKRLLHQLVYDDNASCVDERVDKVSDAIKHTQKQIKEMMQ